MPLYIQVVFKSISCSISEVAVLRFFVMGFRGDWKAFRQVFNFTRHYNVDEALKQELMFSNLATNKLSKMVGQKMFDVFSVEFNLVRKLNPGRYVGCVKRTKEHPVCTYALLT